MNMTSRNIKRSRSPTLISLFFVGFALVLSGCGFRTVPRLDAAMLESAFDGSSDELAWSPGLFESPTIGIKRSNGIRIASDHPPAGVSFRQDGLEIDQTYLLTVSGTPGAQPVSLRWVGDDQRYEYLAAPDGTRSIMVEGTSSLEVLIYADKPFSYDLRRLTLKQCPECLTDARMREQLLKDLPGLQELLKTDRLDAAALLLDWAANVADTGRDAILVTDNDRQISGLRAAEIYSRVLLPNHGGYWCGGKSVFFDKVLALFGFESFTVNFGTQTDSLNHVTVVVVDPTNVAAHSEAASQFFIFDPTFNVTFADEQGDMIGVRELLERSAGGLVDDAVVRQRDLARLDYLVPRSMANRRTCQITERRLGGILLCRNPDLSLNSFFSDPAGWGPRLIRNGFSSDVRGYFELLRAGIFSVGGDQDSEARAAFIDLMRELGIRVDS